MCNPHFFFHSGIPEGTTSLTVYFTVRLFLHRKRLSACSSTGPQCLCWPTSLQLSVYFKFLTAERLAGLSTGITVSLTVPEVLLILVGVNKRPSWRACVHARVMQHYPLHPTSSRIIIRHGQLWAQMDNYGYVKEK